MTVIFILIFPDTLALFYIEADSSDFATGGILFQVFQEDSKWHLVIFISKFLSPVEHNYKIYNKKILAIIYTLEEWHYFIKGAAILVEIWINYKNLKYIMTTKKLN